MTFTEVFEAWLRERACLDPLWATRAGIHDYDDQLTSYDDAPYEARRALAQRTLEVMRQIDLAAIDPADAIDARLFLGQLEVENFDYARHDERTRTPALPVKVMEGIHELLVKDFAPLDQRVASIVARLNLVSDVCAEVRAKLVRPPRLWTENAIEEVDGAIAFLNDLPNRVGDTAGLTEAVTSATAAFGEYRSWLAEDVLPRSDGSFVDGSEAFQFRLQHDHLLTLGVDELEAIGWREFERTLTLLEECASGIDPSRNWQTILEGMQQDHPAADGLMETYRAEVERIRQFLIDHAIVGIPHGTLTLVETPAFMQSSVPFAAYDSPAPLDESRMGIFYVTPEPEGHFLADIPGTTWHEAYPGHHLQYVYAKEVPSKVRRLHGSPLLSEGWGFYCEELAHETGYYDDPRERLMQLNWRLQRAARIILDVGIHVKGMPADDAVKFLVEQVRMRQGQAVGSVYGYSQSPTYFSCYMIGMLELVRIREKFRAKLGTGFTLKEFHERVLLCGNMPPALIESELERTWK